MTLTDIISAYAPQAALEGKFPGFKACFGGEELRKAQAAMTSKLVGGTIEAVIASDMPPSLARLTSHDRELPRTFRLSTTERERGADKQTTQGDSGGGRPGAAGKLSLDKTGPAAPSIRAARAADTGHQSQGVSELEALAELYHDRLVALAVLPPHTGSETSEEAGLQHSRQQGNTTGDLPSSSATDPTSSSTHFQLQNRSSLPSPEIAHDGVTGRSGVLTAAASGGISQPHTPQAATSSQSAMSAAAGSKEQQGGQEAFPGSAAACYEAAYSLGLVLQDLAVRIAAGSEGHLTRLREACQMYRIAVRYRPHSSSALYNWGVALSDLARALKSSEPDDARSCLEQACQRYSEALAAHPDYPQALNNWGLVLQELSGLARGRKDRDHLLRQACSKFRQAIRLRPEFDRGIYNLGTVCYAAACTLQGESTGTSTLHAPHSPRSTPLPSGAQGPGQPVTASHHGDHGHTHGHTHSQGQHVSHKAAQEAEIKHLFTSAAQYIVLAYALQPHKDIYRKSMGVLKRLVPLPFLKAGFLAAVVPDTVGTPEEAWRQDWFVLDAVSLRSATGAEGHLSVASSSPLAGSSNTAPGQLLPPNVLTIPLQAISHVTRTRDPSLPRGEAFVVVLHGAQYDLAGEVVLVAEDEASAESWVDVLTLAAHCVQTRTTEALSEALMPSGGAGGGAQGHAGVH